VNKNRIINIFALDFDLCGWPSIGASAGFHMPVGGSPCGPGKCQVNAKVFAFRQLCRVYKEDNKPTLLPLPHAPIPSGTAGHILHNSVRNKN